MSSHDKEEKPCQQTQGKSSGKKKITKNGSSSSTESPKRPLRPRRPAPTPADATSPVPQHQSPQKPPLNLKRQQLKQQSCFALDQSFASSKHSSDSERFSISSSADSDETDHRRETEKLTFTFSERVQTVSGLSSQADGKSFEKNIPSSSPIKPPRPAQRHSHDYCNGKEGSITNVSLDTDKHDKEGCSTPFFGLAFNEAAAIKPSQNVKDSSKKFIFNNQGGLPLQDAGSKSSGARRKTVGGLETEHGRSAAQFKKPIDGSKGDKPTPPEKPDYVKRHFSMRTPKELEDQLKHQPFFRHDADINMSKSMEAIKKLFPPFTAPNTPSLIIKGNISSTQAKSDAPPKLPLLSIQTKKPESSQLKQNSKDNEVPTPRTSLISSRPGSPLPPSPQSATIQPKFDAPPKPPLLSIQTKKPESPQFKQNSKDNEVPTPRTSLISSRPGSPLPPSPQSATIQPKFDAPPKPPLLSIQTKKPESPQYKQNSKDNEVPTPRTSLISSRPGSPLPPSPQSATIQPKFDAPPKPPLLSIQTKKPESPQFKQNSKDNEVPTPRTSLISSRPGSPLPPSPQSATIQPKFDAPPKPLLLSNQTKKPESPQYKQNSKDNEVPTPRTSLISSRPGSPLPPSPQATTIQPKFDAPPKLSLLSNQTKKPESPQYKQNSKDNEVPTPRTSLISSRPGSPLPPSPQPTAEAPPKPPRTHAHDDYLRVHINVSQYHESKSSLDLLEQAEILKPTVVVIKPTHISDISPVGDEACKMNKVPSIKARTSTKQQPPSPSTIAPPSPVSRTPKTEDTSPISNLPPARPPPPKRRPNSEDHPSGSFMLSHSHSAYHNAEEGWPIVSTFSQSERRKQMVNGHGLSPRRPSDKLPPKPDFGLSLQKYPRHRSLSSECLYSSQGSNLGSDLYVDGGALSRNSFGSQCEAMIDPDGYAVPSTIMHLPGNQSNAMVDEKPAAFSNKCFTRIHIFSGEHRALKNHNFLGDESTPIPEQNLLKVNKKTMNMVRQKINQAFSGVGIVSGGLTQKPDSGWEFVQHGPGVAESQVEPLVLKKRVEYCAAVRRKSSRSIRLSKEFLSIIYPQLFEYCLVVTLRPLVGEDGYEPYIMHKFPENVSGNLSVPSFCFPDATVYRPGSTISLSESYSFVMTCADGTRVYGYCRRIQPPDASLPEVVCVVSPVDAFNMYNTLLNEIEDRRRISLDLASELIAASFGRPLPKPGKVCHIRTLDTSGDMETIFLNRSTDSRLDNVNYESPWHYLGTDKLVMVISSMLMERRIILYSNHLSVLTQTCHALCALLYPFRWQHVYIPLLPGEMLDAVCAPMPFIVGVLSFALPRVHEMDLEEVLIVDLDKKAIVKSQGDESTLLPKAVQKALKTAINMCKVDAEAHKSQWLMITEAFLRMFIEIVGHFTNHVYVQQDGNRIFQKESFVQEIVSRELREFLEWFTETQMFEVFIMNYMDKTECGSSDLFMQRLTEVKESKEELGRQKGLGAKVKNFGKALKTKLVS